MDGGKKGYMDEYRDGWMNRETDDGWMDKWMDRWMDE